jgi:hypothetical protein
MAKLIFVHGLIGTGFRPNPQGLLINPGLKSKSGVGDGSILNLMLELGLSCDR